MKKSALNFLLLISFALASCNPSANNVPMAKFDQAFPKRNRKLTHILGDQLKVRTGQDTVLMHISSTRKTNLIEDANTGDTLFYGKVCRYRGMYYFSQKESDSTYWIYAVKLQDSLIYGLNTAFFQSMSIAQNILHGDHQELLKSKSGKHIWLHAERSDKKILKDLFTSVMDSIPADTILNYNSTMLVQPDTAGTSDNSNQQKHGLLSKVYPNPATDVLYVELKKQGVLYKLTDMSGKQVMSGQFQNLINHIDVSSLPAGTYLLKLNRYEQSNDVVFEYEDDIKIVKI